MLSDAQWAVLEPLAEVCRPKAKTPPQDLQRTLSAILWRHQNGATWRAIPAELHVTPTDADDRAAVAVLADAVQEATGDSMDLAYVDQGYTGERAAKAAADRGTALEVVKLPEAKRGFALLPRRWVVERAFAWMARFRRLARDYKRLPATQAGLHLVAFNVLLLRKAADFAAVRNSL